MKTTNYFLLFLFYLSLAMVSCDKDDNEGEDTKTEEHTEQKEQKVPQSKTEAEQKIQGKWSVSGSADVQSVEFANDKMFILQLSSNSGFIAVNTSRPTDISDFKMEKLASINSPNNTSVPITISGSYTVSADGKTISLGNIATLVIKNLTDDDFSFSISFKESGKKAEVSLTIAPPVDSTNETTLLSKTWILKAWPSYYSTEELAAIADAGLKLSDMKFIFTSSGTFIMTSINMESATSPTPPGGTPPPIEYSASMESVMGIWKWANSQKTAIILTDAEGESDQWSISGLNASSVKINEVDYQAQ